eukprot:1140685-Pelagomonas_calceolata.AAC.10
MAYICTQGWVICRYGGGANAYIRVKYAFIMYIRECKGPFGGGRSWVGGASGRGPNFPPPPGHKHLTMPREKGPEWDYVTLDQPEGTDGVKQGMNKCKLCARVNMCFMELPRASGYTSCKILAVGWPSVQQLRTLGWMLMRMRRGRRRGSSRRRGPAVMGRAGPQAKRST